MLLIIFIVLCYFKDQYNLNLHSIDFLEIYRPANLINVCSSCSKFLCDFKIPTHIISQFEVTCRASKVKLPHLALNMKKMFSHTLPK